MSASEPVESDALFTGATSGSESLATDAVESRTFRPNGVDLHVVLAGTGPDVLLVHGFPDDHSVWRRQIGPLVAAGYRVIAPDTRGCGDSEAPRGRRHYMLDLLVGDLIGLLDALGIDKVRLVAHDWGAIIGWQMVIRHPERIDRFMALSVGHPTAYARGPLEQKRKGWYVFFFALPGIPEWLLRVGNWLPFRAIIRYDDEVEHWVARLSRPGRLTAGINYYRANLATLLFRRCPPARVRVMGVWSSDDRFLAEAQMRGSDAYVEGDWRYERVEDANHWLQLTAPDRVNELMLEFLR
jgi:pimeloyl-ACP methyl ester carboxylesterase